MHRWDNIEWDDGGKIDNKINNSNLGQFNIFYRLYEGKLTFLS